ncbi:hypothetical protein ACJJIQ_05170 [Microbulbifer sp. ANSA003]|uniref:hypothetical protein n=1 Tax=Microbulbifer sp. ANSA003 TaxID=3243360 RepID=UPI0040426E6E
MAGRIIKLDEVTFTEPSLPTLEVSDEDIYMASFPGLRVWFDPREKYESVAGSRLRERMQSYEIRQYALNSWTIDSAAIGGQSAMVFDQNESQGAHITDQAAHPLGTYTKVAVIRPGVLGGWSGLLSAESGLASFKIISTSALQVDHGGTTSSTTETLASNTDYVVMACYNAETQAVAVYINGIESEMSSATLVAPVAPEDVCLGFIPDQGNFFDGAIGDALVFSVDYGLPEYASHRAALFSTLMTKYGISA